MCHKYMTMGYMNNFVRIRRENIKVENRHTCIMQSSQWKSECHRYVTLIANALIINNTYCTSWLEAVNDEMRTRGPSCIIRSRRKTNTSLSFDGIKKEMIECFALKPTFNMFFVALEEEDSPPQRCHCEYLPINSSSVSLNMWNSFLMKGKDLIVGMFFPKVPDDSCLFLISRRLYNLESTMFKRYFSSVQLIEDLGEITFGRGFHGS
ncbi:F-box only protein 22-like isoform X1 [Vespula squamosa]|uniref:F-box only protein 22-like isoform X1 n=1 Tax=Vespula squamosa TaxID=30214 RepID=A0ABD1ZTZ8_VESSQ